MKTLTTPVTVINTNRIEVAITEDLLAKADKIAQYIGNRTRSKLDILNQISSMGIELSEFNRILKYWKTLRVKPTEESRSTLVVKVINNGKSQYFSLTENGKAYFAISKPTPQEIVYQEPTEMLLAFASACRPTRN
jgi:hypothetical protein